MYLTFLQTESGTLVVVSLAAAIILGLTAVGGCTLPSRAPADTGGCWPADGSGWRRIRAGCGSWVVDGRLLHDFAAGPGRHSVVSFAAGLDTLARGLSMAGGP